jgi:hypothetical protein
MCFSSPLQLLNPATLQKHDATQLNQMKLHSMMDSSINQLELLQDSALLARQLMQLMIPMQQGLQASNRK